MNESILNTIKLMLGVEKNCDQFDTDIIIDINSVLFILNQLGIGKKNFCITGSGEETWGDFIGDESKLQAVKTYVYLRVRLLFDPPASATLVNTITESIKEYGWRLNIEVDPGEEDPA